MKPRSFRTWQFKQLLLRLPTVVRAKAGKQFALWRENPAHPSLQFKRVGAYYSARIDDDYRALAVWSEADACFVWFWVGKHTVYDRILKQSRS